MARDDDIFRKLKKETPLIKRKDLQPLASRDFQKSAFDIRIEKPQQKKRVVQKTISPADLDVFSRASAKARPPAARRDAGAFGPARTRRQADDAPAQSREREKAAREAALARAKAQAEQERARTRQSALSRNAESARPRDELEVFPGTARAGREQKGRGVETTPFGLPDVSGAPAKAAANGDMSFRHELKYYINYRDYIMLRNTLKALLPLDRFAGEKGDYHIRSLYFDDIYESALAEKIMGSDSRHKYRIRIYNFLDDNIKFEKKIKSGQYIAKQSIRLGRAECDSLIAGDFGVLEGRKEPLASEIYLQMKNNILRPRVIVDYRREAYVSPVENVRITFDKDLKAGLWRTDIFNEAAPTMPVLESGTMVLEVKFDRHLPVPIKGVLNAVNAAERNAISKYVLCRRHD